MKTFEQRLDEALKSKKKWDDQSYAIIVGKFDDESVAKLVEIQKNYDLDEPQKPEEMHVTMRFWLADSVSDEIKNKMDDWADKEVEVEAGPVKILGDEKSLAVTLKSDELMKLQKEMDEWLQSKKVPPSDFPTFLAHTTIGYGAEDGTTNHEPTKLKLVKFVLEDKTH